MSEFSAGFRYDIGFLRCVAVLSVVSYHLKIPYLTGGLAGVDVFFVISGYLMTKIIQKGIQHENLRLKDFYKSRIRRIAPPLFFLTLLFFFLVYFLTPVKLYDFCRFGLSSCLFISNFYYYVASSYFEPTSQFNFMLHTWSLSVECQFYLLYPLLLFAVKDRIKRSPKTLCNVLFILTLGSFMGMIYSYPKDQSFAFYMPHTRLWEMTLGGIAFLYQEAFKKKLTIRIRNGLAIIALFVLLSTFTSFTNLVRQGWPSWYTVIPVLSTFCILLAQSSHRLFRFRVAQFVGKISYSWYLWHWPLLIMAGYLAITQSPVQKLTLFFFSFICAALSYFLLERTRYRLPSKRLIIYMAAIALLVFAGAKIPVEHLLLNSRDAALAGFHHHYKRTTEAHQYGFGKGHLQIKQSFSEFNMEQLYKFSNTKKNILLLGDSHAGMFSQTLRQLSDQYDFNLLQATADATFPAPASQFVNGPSQLFHYIFNRYLPENVNRIHQVIVCADYYRYGKNQLSGKLQTLVDYMKEKKLPVLYIGQTERYSVEYPAIESLSAKFGTSGDQYLNHNAGLANNFIKNFVPMGSYIDIYCSPAIRKSNETETYMYDAEHLSLYGTEQYSRRILEHLSSQIILNINELHKPK